jgi:hypothetical protein
MAACPSAAPDFVDGLDAADRVGDGTFADKRR